MKRSVGDWYPPSQGVLSMRKQSHKDCQQNPSKTSGPQGWAGLNVHFLHVTPTVTDSAAGLATARSLLPLLTVLSTSHPQPRPQPSVNALLFQHFKPLSPNLYLRTQPCVSQFHPPKKWETSRQESFSCSASLSPTWPSRARLPLSPPAPRLHSAAASGMPFSTFPVFPCLALASSC